MLELELEMDARRRRGGARSSVVPGSVWESRMKSDEVRGGIKVFNGGEEKSQERSTNGVVAARGRRKTWKSETSEGFHTNQILIARTKSNPQNQKDCDEPCKNRARKTKTEGNSTRKLRSETPKVSESDSVENVGGFVEIAKLESDQVLDESKNRTDGEIETIPVEFGTEKEKEKESFDVKEISVSEPKLVKKPENEKRRVQQIETPESIIPLTSTVKQSSPIKRHSTIYQNFRKVNSIPKAQDYHGFPQTQNKLQSLVDLIMWRDVSRSAFVFGIGTFIIVSSSYAVDINLNSISVMSYLGLVYLAVIFLYRSFICRGVIDLESANYVVGEEEAIWVVKLILPYLNEFLFKLRALFSGDPGTTMKLAVLLYVLARWGSSITVWKMAKLGFFGVFTVPKIFSLYSAQLTAYANFWFGRFRDAWDSCSHKKAVALGIFGLVWNLASVVARVWAVFVLFVALRYYHQKHWCWGRDESVEEDEVGCEEETWHEPASGVEVQRQALKKETNKVKKGF